MATRQKIKRAYTFDDVLLVPQHSKVLPREVDLSTRLTKSITLNIPILSAAMDTVTESEMAIALAREGGIGVIHKNMSIDRQVKEATKVKRAESGIILDPVTISPEKTIRDAIAVMKHHEISGLPVLDGAGKILGILTERDIRFESKLDQSVADVMTKDLITAKQGTTLSKAKEILQKNRIEKLLIVNRSGKLAGMVTVRDILMKERFPTASLDSHGRLLVAAAVGASDDLSERAGALVNAGLDVVVLDSAHGHSQGVLDAVSKLKSKHSDIPVIAGNVATASGTKALIDAGADAVKIGIGAGASCTTRIVSGIGVPQFTAVVDAVDAAAKSDTPVISDGGIRFSGDMAKVLHDGRQYKSFRGMGSLGPMREGSADRYFQEGESGIKLVPEGVEGLVPYRGSLSSVIYQLVGGLRASMGYCGAKDIASFKEGDKFIEISSASYAEGHPHDLKIVKDAPNYQQKEN